MDNTGFYSKIESLDVSDNLKVIFHFLSANVKKRTLLGVEYYPTMKHKGNFLKVCNVFVLLFGAFYYLFKGMWKKGVIILSICIGSAFIAPLLSAFFDISAHGEEGLDKAVTFLIFIFQVRLSQVANYDLYRKYVLEEDFWW